MPIETSGSVSVLPISVDLLAVLVTQGRDLFGNEPHQENKYRRAEQQPAHIGKAVDGEERVEVVTEARPEERQADREKHFERRIQRADLEDNEQEANPIAAQPDVAPA